MKYDFEIGTVELIHVIFLLATCLPFLKVFATKFGSVMIAVTLHSGFTGVRFLV